MDQVARDKASEASHGLNNHIAVTGIKLDTLDSKMDRLESIIKWAGGLIVMLVISTLSWSLAQQYNANESTKKDLQAQVQLLREQQRNGLIARDERQEILSRLPSGGAETPAATDALRQ